jgi:hypothetical protein
VVEDVLPTDDEDEDEGVVAGAVVDVEADGELVVGAEAEIDARGIDEAVEPAECSR